MYHELVYRAAHESLHYYLSFDSLLSIPRTSNGYDLDAATPAEDADSIACGQKLIHADTYAFIQVENLRGPRGVKQVKGTRHAGESGHMRGLKFQ